MSTCHVQASGTVDLYFYGELTGAERNAVERHVTRCVECRRALEELAVIRAALEARPDVGAPPGGDWSGFMRRLQTAVAAEHAAPGAGRPRAQRPVAAALAMAALLALITVSALVVLRDRGASTTADTPGASATGAGSVEPPPAPVTLSFETDAALAEVSEHHFERSKLVVLGLATKDPADSTASDWDYERTLATSLLNDTRLYRQAAEKRGMRPLAGVMRDLEIVLLQTSMSEAPDAESLAQLQRLIRRRDLITKMDVVATAGLVP